MNNLSLLTYTHSNTVDLHPPYFDRLDKYFPVLDKHYVLSDKPIPRANLITIIYDNSTDYFKQMLDGLEQIATEYLIYSQEDYLLIDYVDVSRINELIQILDANRNISFIRLIYSGIPNKTTKYNENLIYIDSNNQYFFSTQISIWRKTDLIEMFKKSKVKSVRDEPANSNHLASLGKIGLCTTSQGKKVGAHYNSTIYPYIATAIVRGKWNESEYHKELADIYVEYAIDKNIRGIR